MALPAFVAGSASQFAFSASATERKFAKPAGTGQYLIVTVWQGVTGAKPTISGFTQIHQTSGAAQTVTVFGKFIEAGDPAEYTIALGATTSSAFHIARYENVNLAAPVNAHGGKANTSSTSQSAPSITTTVPNCLLVLTGANETGAKTTAMPAGFTERLTAEKIELLADKEQAKAEATGEQTATLASAQANVGILIALAPAVTKVQEKGYSPPAVSSFATSGMANFAVGDMVIVNFAGSRGARVSSISGGGVATWLRAVLAENGEKPEDGAEIWYGMVTTGGTNNVVTVNFNKATTEFDPLVVSEWSGLNSLDKTSTNAGKSATMSTKKVAPTAAGELFICIGRIYEESKSGGPSGGWTEMSAAGHSGNASAFIIAAGSGEEATSWSLTSDFWAMAMAVFSPALASEVVGTMAGSAKCKFGTAAALSGQGKLAGIAKAKTAAKGTLIGEEEAAPSAPVVETRYRQQEVLQPGRYMLRHIAPEQSQEGEPGILNPLGEGVAVLSKTLYANPLPISRLPDSPDFHEGSYTLRLLDSGEFTLTFPNRDASDGQPWRSRFSARGHTEYLEISREGEIETIGCILKVSRDRQKIMVTGYDGVFLLRKAYEQEWTGVIAPRDMIERYSSLWVQALLWSFPEGSTTGFSETGLNILSFPEGTGTATASIGPAGGLVARVTGTSNTNRGDVAVSNGADFTIPSNGAWRAVIPFTVLKSVGNWGLSIEVSSTDPEFPSNALELSAFGSEFEGVASYFATGLGTTTGVIGVPHPVIGQHTLTMECDGRWVFYYVDGELLAIRPAMVQPSTKAELSIVVKTAGLSAPAEGEVRIGRYSFAQREPFLMRGTEKGEYVLPGSAASYPTGGLHGRYLVQGATTSGQRWWEWLLAPDPRRAGFPTFIEDQPAGLTGSQEPAGVPTTYYAARWFGAVYMKAGTYKFNVGVGNSAGYRLWVGKTQWGDQIIDQWSVGASRSTTATYVAERDGWYPVVVEFFRASESINGTCSLKFQPTGVTTYTDPGGTSIVNNLQVVIPATSLSPLGCVDARVQGSSHYDLVMETAKNAGYQLRAEPRQLESGEFPCALIPKARVGIETDEVVETDDRDQRSGMNGWSVTDDATDSVSSLKAFGSGIADGKGSQIAFEAIGGQEVTQDLFDLQGWVNAGDIAFPALLAARAEAERELRAGVWQNIEGEPTARDRLADTFPLSGVLNQFRWRPSDGVRLWLPEGSVRDSVPRQILQVTRNFNSEGRSNAAIGFRARPKDPTAALRAALREATRSPRAYQRAYTSRMGTFMQVIPLGIGATSAPSICTLLGNEEIVDARVFISLNVSAKPVKLKINGTDRTSALGGPWTGPAVVDIREFATPESSAAGQRIFAQVIGASESNTEVDFQLVLTLLV